MIPRPGPAIANLSDQRRRATRSNAGADLWSRLEWRAKEKAMGLAWQQGPLATRSVGQFLVADPLPERLLYAEPLRRRMRVRFGGQWVADSEDVVLLHEPSHYPVAFFPLADVRDGVLEPETRTTNHRDFGATAWFGVRTDDA